MVHLLIIIVFILVFVALYLYNLINDIKRINNEVKKLTTDVQQITKDLNNLVTISSSLNRDVYDLKSNSCKVPVVSSSIDKVLNEDVEKKSLVSEEYIESDDDTSVNTDELKKIITENDGGDEVDEEAGDDEVQITERTTTDYENMTYLELKELCKQKGLNSKGTKEALKSRLEMQ